MNEGNSKPGQYIGRFAPSPTGPLHAGSLVAALASWLDAKAHDGVWLVRLEDIDTPRNVPGASQEILRQLAAVGLLPDEPPVYQSARTGLYQKALNELIAYMQAYPCACSRKDIEAAFTELGDTRHRGEELVYPGTCRPDHGGLQGKSARAWRFLTAFQQTDSDFSRLEAAQAAPEFIAHSLPALNWLDRRLGYQQQDVEAQVGDFVLKRADGMWAYQLAVVVDDAAQGVTHVVRGEDLLDNTPRQILLQRSLGYLTPEYLHTPLVLGTNGEKLSKQNGAQALDVTHPLHCLTVAAHCLGLPPVLGRSTISDALNQWRQAWFYN